MAKVIYRITHDDYLIYLDDEVKRTPDLILNTRMARALATALFDADAKPDQMFSEAASVSHATKSAAAERDRVVQWLRKQAQLYTKYRMHDDAAATNAAAADIEALAHVFDVQTLHMKPRVEQAADG